MKFKKGEQSYSLVDENENALASTFCGVVSNNIVNKLPSLPMNDHNTRTLMGFYVDINHRNKGIGKKFLQEIIGAENERGASYITLRVEKNNEHAIRLYESCGFIKEGDCCGKPGMHFMYLELTGE